MTNEVKMKKEKTNFIFFCCITLKDSEINHVLCSEHLIKQTGRQERKR